MTDHVALFAGSAVALYAAHHVGDYWVQTDFQAKHKGEAGALGKVTCTLHVLTYVLTQWVFLTAFLLVTQRTLMDWRGAVALAISGVTHWTADRRERGLMFWLAHCIPGKADFLKLGAPRLGVKLESWDVCDSCEGAGTSHDESTDGKCWDCRGGGRLPVQIGDNPSLGTGAWALDQAWHIFWGVFVAALVIAS